MAWPTNLELNLQNKKPARAITEDGTTSASPTSPHAYPTDIKILLHIVPIRCVKCECLDP